MIKWANARAMNQRALIPLRPELFQILQAKLPESADETEPIAHFRGFSCPFAIFRHFRNPRSVRGKGALE
jgi:hypothetical protein